MVIRRTGRNKSLLLIQRLLSLVPGFLTMVLVMQLVRWQVIQSAEYKRVGEYFTQSKKQLITRRGDIYTADGVTVATDRIYWDVYLSIVHEEEYNTLVAKWGELRKIFEEHSVKLPDDPPELKNLGYWKTGLSLDESGKKGLEKRVNKLRIPGVYFQERVKRIYPGGSFMAHVLGFVAATPDNEQGIYGVEGYFWPEIKGRSGKILHEQDVTGNLLSFADYKTYKAREGKNIQLTIRAKIQRKVEEILAKKVKEYKAQSGTVIIMDPHTGAIISMANYPVYDPNYYFKEQDYSVFKNKAVSDPYEFGSVQKPLTLAIALQERKINPDYKCFDSGVLEVLDKKIYNYHRRKYGWLDITGILRHSDNVCAATVGLMLTPKVFYDYLHRLGIGTLINIGLQEEETGYIKSYSKWNKVDLAVASFGQMISATPLQIITAHSALANNGWRMQPYLIQKVYDANSKFVFNPYRVVKVFDEDVVHTIVNAMVDATMHRGLFHKYLGRIKIAGKTGTAQIPDPIKGGYYEDLVNTTFVGFAPADNPKFIMIVKFEKIKEPASGSTTAAPTWLEIFEAIRKDLGIDF